MQDGPKPLYRPGTIVHIVTASKLNFRGPVIDQKGDYLTIKDAKTGRRTSFNLLRIELVEVLSKEPPEPDRDSPGRCF